MLSIAVSVTVFFFIGVIVHIHDICSSDGYTFKPCTQFITQRGWTEQDLLVAFLHGNREWKIIYIGVGVVYLQKQQPGFVRAEDEHRPPSSQPIMQSLREAMHLEATSLQMEEMPRFGVL